MRNDFRNFRVDRISDASIGPEPFGKRRVILLKEWEAVWSARTTKGENSS
jgi:predicted DNA-binding transcriptional regulator YafY